MKHFNIHDFQIYSFWSYIHHGYIQNVRDDENLKIKIIEFSNPNNLSPNNAEYLLIAKTITAHLKKESFEPFIFIDSNVSIFSKKNFNFTYPDDTDAVFIGISPWALDNNEQIGTLNNLKLLQSKEHPHLFRDLNMLSKHGLFIASYKYAIYLLNLCLESATTKFIPNTSIQIVIDKPLFNIYALATPIFYQTVKIGGASGTDIEFHTSTITESHYENVKATKEIKKNKPTIFICGRSDSHYCGFFSLFFQVIGAIDHCSDKNYVPIINYCGSSFACYFERENFVLPNGKVTNNVWEYYFEQPPNSLNLTESDINELTKKNNNDIQYEDYNLCVRLDLVLMDPICCFKIDYYSPRTKKMSEMACSLKLHQYVLDHINSYYNMNFSGLRILGVHIRVTDKPTELKDTKQLDTKKLFSIDEYATKIKYLKNKYSLDKIFICSESQIIINQLSAIIPCLYTDSYRSNLENISSHFQKDSRSDHHFRMGLEAIIDTYLLARCTGLLCWKSNVSDAAIYLSHSQYEFLEYME